MLHDGKHYVRLAGLGKAILENDEEGRVGFQWSGGWWEEQGVEDRRE